MGWPCSGVAQSFHQYPLEMHSPKGGGVGEVKPWLSSGSPLDTFLLNLGRYVVDIIYNL